jgi:hypothetical protein
MGLSGQKAQSEHRDEAASEKDIGVVPCDEIALNGSIHACTSFYVAPRENRGADFRSDGIQIGLR